MNDTTTIKTTNRCRGTIADSILGRIVLCDFVLGGGSSERETIMISDTQREVVVSICDELAYGITEEDVVATSEPVENFIDNCRAYRSLQRDTIESLPVTTIEGGQVNKGDRRADVVIVDFGTFRAVVKM